MKKWERRRAIEKKKVELKKGIEGEMEEERKKKRKR